MSIELVKSETKKYVIENVPDELVNFVQAAQVTCMSNQDMLLYMISKQDFNEDSFIKYHNDRYLKAFLEFDTAKDRITKEMTPDEIKNCANVSWNMDFKNKTITFTADINDKIVNPSVSKVFDISVKECDKLKELQIMVSAMNDLLSYMINRNASSYAIDTYIKIKNPIFAEYDSLKEEITNKYTPDEFTVSGSKWEVNFDENTITFTR